MEMIKTEILRSETLLLYKHNPTRISMREVEDLTNVDSSENEFKLELL